MFRRFFARALTSLNSPTADLYFADACADWLADGRVVRYAPTVFASDTTRLVIRHDGRAPAASRRARTVHLIDDAIDLEGADAALSPYWRFKLNRVERAAANALLPGAAAVVVSSEPLEAMMRTRATALGRSDLAIRRLDPYWTTPQSDLAHHARPTFRVAYLGAQTHRPDIEAIAPALAGFLEAAEDAELILAGGHEALPAFARNPKVRTLGPLGWADYRRRLSALKPHAVLYPLAETPFNAARSLNKLIEHGVVGAAGLYAAHWPGARMAEDAGAGMALPMDPAAWRAALDGLMFSRERTVAMAAAGQSLAASLNDAAMQRRIWAELLEIEP